MNSRRRNVYRAYYALAVVFAAVIALLLCLTVFFRVSSVEVRGVSLYTSDQIINVGGAEYGMNLVRTDTDRIADRLLGNLVYIDEVKVVKSYPSTIIISCTEAVKAADIEYDGRYYVLSYSGKLLESGNRQPTGDIPVVKGFSLDEEKLEPGDKLAATDEYSAKVLMSLLKQLEKHEFEGVSEIDISSRADIIIQYQDRLTLRLGSSADLDYKLSCFSKVIESLGEEYYGEVIYNGEATGYSAIPQERTTETTTAAPAEDTAAESGEAASDTVSSELDTWWVPETTTTEPQTWWTPEETTTEQTWWTPEENTYDDGGGYSDW